MNYAKQQPNTVRIYYMNEIILFAQTYRTTAPKKEKNKIFTNKIQYHGLSRQSKMY